jgi:hypothetical protein
MTFPSYTAPLSSCIGSPTPPPPTTPSLCEKISTGVCIHTVCNRGVGGSGASDRETPAAKYLYWSLKEKI